MSDPVAETKFVLHRFARSTSDAQAINKAVDRLVARTLDVDLLAEASMLAAGSHRINGRIPLLHEDRARRIADLYALLVEREHPPEMAPRDLKERP